MEKILIDTDVLIDFLRGHNQRIRDIFTKVENKSVMGFVSSVTVTELFAGADTKDTKKTAALETLISFFELIVPDLQTSKSAGFLKRKFNLGIADAIIAATAETSGMSLFTFNSRHFRGIPKIKIYQI